MVSISTIRRFEGGYDISFSKLVHLLKALGLEKNLELLVPDYENRPSYHLAHEQMPKRVKKSVKKKAGESAQSLTYCDISSCSSLDNRE